MPDIDFFRSIPNLNGLNEGQISTLVDLLAFEDVDDGHVFIEEGQSGDKAYFILDGEVSVTRLKGSDERVKEINRMAPREVFGVIALIDSKVRSATCSAKGKVRVATLARDAFEGLHGTAPEIAHHIQRIISRQIARDHKYLSDELHKVIVSGNASEALKNQDGLIIMDTYKGIDRRTSDSANYDGPERRAN